MLGTAVRHAAGLALRAVKAKPRIGGSRRFGATAAYRREMDAAGVTPAISEFDNASAPQDQQSPRYSGGSMTLRATKWQLSHGSRTERELEK